MSGNSSSRTDILSHQGSRPLGAAPTCTKTTSSSIPMDPAGTSTAVALISCWPTPPRRLELRCCAGPCDFHRPYRNPTSGGRASWRADRQSSSAGASPSQVRKRASISCLIRRLVGGGRCRRATNRARAAILVDATGRSSSIASRFGGRRIVYDRLVALVGLFQERSATATSDQRTIVESRRVRMVVYGTTAPRIANRHISYGCGLGASGPAWARAVLEPTD